jgi:hypothetical protein
MPVYRIGTGRGENIHSFSRELDAWLKTVGWTRASTNPPDKPGEDSDASREAPATAATRSHARVQEPRAESREAAVWTSRLWRLVAGHAASAVGLSILVASALVTVVWQAGRSVPAFEPVTVLFEGDSLRVLDANRDLLFSHKFGLPLLPPDRYGPRGVLGKRYLIEDLNGDGSQEVVLFVPRRDPQFADELVCYNKKGTVLFTRTPNQSVRFGNMDYAPPWAGHYLFVTGEAGKRTLWVTWTHIATGFFPCLLERLSADGSPRSEYWSAGYIMSVSSAVVNGVPSILVGAANNDHKAASLAVFPEDRVLGAAPAEDEDKVCRTCPPGAPVAFLVFPRLELADKGARLPGVTESRQQATGEIRVWVDQRGYLSREDLLLPGCVYYDLSADLVPVRSGFTAEYVASHRDAESRRYVDHAFGQQDFERLWPVLMSKGQTFVPITGLTDYSEGTGSRRQR